jgi:hypothetical protein
VARPWLDNALQCHTCSSQQPLIKLRCYRKCVTDTLHGPGVNRSQCPVCQQPIWKKDLHKDTQLAALTEAIRPLVVGPASNEARALSKPPASKATSPSTKGYRDHGVVSQTFCGHGDACTAHGPQRAGVKDSDHRGKTAQQRVERNAVEGCNSVDDGYPTLLSSMPDLQDKCLPAGQSPVQLLQGKRAARICHTELKRKRCKSGCKRIVAHSGSKPQKCAIESEHVPDDHPSLCYNRSINASADPHKGDSASQGGAPHVTEASQRPGSLEVPDWVANYEPTQGLAGAHLTCAMGSEALQPRQASGFMKAPESNIDYIFASLRAGTEPQVEDMCALQEATRPHALGSIFDTVSSHYSL